MEKSTGRRIFGRGADVAITVGLVGAAGAAVTGAADWSKMGGGHARRIGLAHGLINFAGAACYATSLVLRKRGRRAAGRDLSLLGFAFSAVAAYLGGHLVYGRQIGVDHTASLPLPEEFVSVLPEAELPENKPTSVQAGGTPVLLLRRREKIYALAGTCAHLGGPLPEGKIEDGTVVCPWHGSRYSLEDGRVLEGPSAYPQPVFETRVRDGNIEVRAAKR